MSFGSGFFIHSNYGQSMIKLSDLLWRSIAGNESGITPFFCPTHFLANLQEQVDNQDHAGTAYAQIPVEIYASQHQNKVFRSPAFVWFPQPMVSC